MHPLGVGVGVLELIHGGWRAAKDSLNQWSALVPATVLLVQHAQSVPTLTKQW